MRDTHTHTHTHTYIYTHTGVGIQYKCMAKLSHVEGVCWEQGEPSHIARASHTHIARAV